MSLPVLGYLLLCTVDLVNEYEC